MIGKISVLTICLLTNNEWLTPYLEGVRKPHELKKINLYEVLYHSLDYEKQRLLEKLAPAKMEVPSGSSIKIMYRDNGEAPVLAARIQELFGMAETPTVNEGKTTIAYSFTFHRVFKPVSGDF